jgi:hypothetical protein
VIGTEENATLNLSMLLLQYQQSCKAIANEINNLDKSQSILFHLSLILLNLNFLSFFTHVAFKTRNAAK